MAGGAAGGATAAAHAAQMNAVKACGVLVKLDPDAFLDLLERSENPAVVHSEQGFFTTTYRYLTSYRGLAFHCDAVQPLVLPGHCELFGAAKISLPG